MRRFDPELMSGAVMLAVMLLAASPVLFLGAQISIPYAVWLGVFVVMIATLVASTWDMRRSTVQYAMFALAVVASWVLIFTGHGRGLLPILLVVTAAVSPYVIPVWAGFVTVLLNVIVLVVSMVAPSPPWEAGVDAVEITAMSGFYVLIQVASLLSSVALLREQQARRDLAETHVELQGATALLSESTRAAERLRISRELHDLIGHQLTVLALELEAAKHRDRTGEAGQHIDRADGVARELLQSVRNTVGELRQESSSIAELLERVVRDLPEPRVTLDVAENLMLDEEHTTLIVRAVQEIVTNTIRHARAQRLTISVQSAGDGIAVRSEDNGRGTSNLTLGNGLLGLRERFEQCGGDVSFSSARDEGFRVSATVPAASRLEHAISSESVA